MFRKFLNIGYFFATIGVLFIMLGVYQTVNKVNTKLIDNSTKLDSVIIRDQRHRLHDSIELNSLMKIVKTNTEILGGEKK